MIILWALASGVIAFGYSIWAVNNGLEVPISGATLGLSIAVIAIILLALAVPIWKYKRNLIKATDLKPNRNLPVNPFYAVKVLTLAKASAITAAMFLGWHAGVLVKQLTAPVVVPEAMTLNITALVSAVFLLIAAFLVEQVCKLPDDKKTSND
jgi:cytochrome c oxidase assembly factor CtaG